jgi:serine/threonine protein kinase
MVGDKYLIVEVKSSALRTTVWLAIDTITGDPCILKQAHRYCGFAVATDPVERLHREAAVLISLSDEICVPNVRELFEEGHDGVLVTDYCDGSTMEEHVKMLANQGRFLDVAEITAWGLKLSTLLERLHGRGLIYGDLKPPNVIIDLEEGKLFIVDFEGSTWAESGEATEMMTTTGFASPHREAGGMLTRADDLYAFGALLYFMATGADPSHAPNPSRLLERPPEVINPALGPVLARLISDCLESDPLARPQSAEAVSEELRRVRHHYGLVDS